jgi:hypothetical protein
MTTKTLNLIAVAFLGVLVIGALRKHQETPSVTDEVTAANPTPEPTPVAPLDPTQYTDQQLLADEPLWDESRLLKPAERDRIERTAVRDADNLWRQYQVYAPHKPIRLD